MQTDLEKQALQAPQNPIRLHTTIKGKAMMEIERKFLVHNDKLPSLDASTPMRQAYLVASNGRSTRIRQAGERYILTIKIAADGISRHEVEVDVQPKQGAAMFKLPLLGAIVEKQRHLIEHQGHTWELDTFNGANKGLMVAEIELTSEDEAFERPQWLGPEVTGDPRFGNINLASYPYSKWGIGYKNLLRQS